MRLPLRRGSVSTTSNGISSPSEAATVSRMPASVVKASSRPWSVRFLTLSRFGSELSDPPAGTWVAAGSGDGELGRIGRATITEPLQTVGTHVLDQRYERPTLLGQRVLHPWRN